MVDRDVETILSAKTCLDLNLISTADEVQHVNLVKNSDTNRLTNLKQQYDDVFNGLGELPQPVKIYIKANAIPIQQP